MESPPSRSPCPICLESIVDEAYLDPCFHRFCYPCILQWFEMVLAHPPLDAKSQQDVLECPLCKARCTLLVHNLIGKTFDRSYLLSAESQRPKFFLTTAHARRLAVYYGNPRERTSPNRNEEAVKTDFSMNRKIWNGENTILGYGTARERFSPDRNGEALKTDFSMNRKIWDGENTILGYGTTRERSSLDRNGEALKTDFTMNRKIWKGENTILGYRVRKEELRRWIHRELQALQREEDVDLLMHHVIGILEHFDRELRKGIPRLPLPWKAFIHDAVEPFLGDNSNLFADEIEKFLLSGLTVEAYDRLYIVRDESCLEDRAPSC